MIGGAVELQNKTNTYKFKLLSHEILYLNQLFVQLPIPINHHDDDLRIHEMVELKRDQSWDIAFQIQEFLRDGIIHEFIDDGYPKPILATQVTESVTDQMWPISHNNKRFLEKFSQFILDCNGVDILD